VATNILGDSGRAMMAPLIDGERDPDVLAEMAGNDYAPNTMLSSRH